MIAMMTLAVERAREIFSYSVMLSPPFVGEEAGFRSPPLPILTDKKRFVHKKFVDEKKTTTELAADFPLEIILSVGVSG